MAIEMNNSICRCCLLAITNENDVKLLNMQNSSFIYNNISISFLDGYFDITHCSPEDFSKIPVANAQICPPCMVQLESAYIFRKLCHQANVVLDRKYNEQIKNEKESDDCYDNAIVNQLAEIKPTLPITLAANEPTENFKCNVCSEVLTSENMRFRHNVEKHVNFRHHCENCEKSFLTQGAFQLHLNECQKRRELRESLQRKLDKCGPFQTIDLTVIGNRLKQNFNCCISLNPVNSDNFHQRNPADAFKEKCSMDSVLSPQKKRRR